MGAVEAREGNHAEPGLDEILASDPEFLRVATHLKKSSGSDAYKVTKVYRIQRNSLLQAHEAKAGKLGKPTQLFHGTSLSRAKAIAKEGFGLPSRAGLYGKGIYFADNASKSAAYAPENSWAPFFRRWSKDGFMNAFKRESGQMLLCDVYLGSYRTVMSCDTTLSPEKDLQAGWFRNMFSLGDYNSVYAPGGFLSHSEYIVYETHQAIPRYLVEFAISPN